MCTKITICVQKKMQVFNVLWYICLCSPILIFIKEAEVQERGFFFLRSAFSGSKLLPSDQN
jgi:hypothetical protein